MLEAAKNELKANTTEPYPSKLLSPDLDHVFCIQVP